MAPTISKAAILRLTVDDGKDEVDGSELNAVRRRALELAEPRSEDDMTDAEILARAPEEFWYIDLCIEQLHRLTSEIDQLIGCREYTALQAYAIVKRAMGELSRTFANTPVPT